MHFNNLFTIFTIIMLIIVVLLSDSFVTAIVLCMLLVNLLTLCSHYNVIDIDYSTLGNILPSKVTKIDSDKVDLNKEQPVETASDIELSKPATPHMYGPEYDAWQTNQTSYSECYNEPQLPLFASCAESGGVDARLSLLAQQRARDRKCMDGVVSKNADYYKFHFADELEQSESKPWWGLSDE